MRIKNKFDQLKSQNKKAFISYICAGDPNFDDSLEILKSLPDSCDLIELGVPFLDPAGDGPIIEDASKRAINNGMTLKKVMAMVVEFRKENSTTPIILMTYFNPLLKYGLEKIFSDMKQAGVDGVLIVDLPLEEEHEVVEHVKSANIDFIRLISPNSGEARIANIVKNASGFLYLISMLGITGTKSAKASDNEKNLKIIRKLSDLPISIGFGIKNAQIAQEFSKIDTDGIIVGSTFVKEIENSYKENIKIKDYKDKICQMAKEFKEAIND